MLKLVDLPVLHKFTLYRTRTNYYLIGRDEKKTFWRILKIDRTDPNELNLFEDPTRYTHDEITQLKKWISRGNQKYGGLRAETTCYGIIGFVKFLGPYYMLVIKRRKKVGEICGHTVYGVAESQMIMIPYPSRKTIDADSSAERNYTYHLMYSLQKNICNTERGKIHDETMFVWNEYLTHGIRRNLRNTVWTVALTKCLVSDEQFILTVIARRSRHYAGTRYLRRGVNEEGSVANEVETEQIVTKEVPEGKHRENILREEFEKAILFINGGTRRENHLKANHFDLNEHYKSGADRAFKLLCADGKEALESINLFFGEVPSGIGADLVINDTFFNPILNQDEEATSSEQEALKADIFMRQTGVFRSNCIDCLDRTNVAQFAYGLVALARQLQKLGIRGPPIVDKNNPLAKKLMEVYENMGDAIAMQYAGSDAHIKMFSALRGDWNIIKKNRDKIIALRRHLYNTFQDSEKQNAINVFLGEFKPQLGKPALWELPSDQRNTMRNSSNLNINKLRPNHSRSFSDNLILESLDPKELVQENHQPSRAGLNSGWETTSNGGWETTSNGGWETTSEVGFCEAEPSSSRVHSVIRDEDNLRGIGSRQMFLEVGSTSDSHGLEDAPGLSHSYNATFITAEEMFERCR
ncbi:hypothetical protein HID58_083287 [Brassica napus]|uniref:SAC domain-containing protein n=1 Tax=Brassica napus TaxID=3708 RepID=A0ABQ7YCX6_BRANA|nr:hypothetical protein HID58_083287 [Brassica napus]